MLLPKNERRNLNATKKKVVWIYGAPFSGKTFFANQFPDPLMLNTDGNIKFVDAPYIAIRDTVTVEGRLTKRQLAWDVFPMPWPNWKRSRTTSKPLWLTCWKIPMRLAVCISVTGKGGNMKVMIPSGLGIW